MKTERVKRISVSEEIFNILHKKIISGELTPGEKLPSQDKLAELYSVSRNTIREAINRLMVMGLVSSKQGVGTVVEPVSAGSYVSSLSSHLSLHPITVRDFIEARMAVEPMAVRLAALRATPAERNGLQEIMDRMRAYYLQRDVDAFSEWSTRFHVELAKMCGNSVLVKFLETIWDFLRNFISEMSSIPDSMEKSMEYHGAICDAVMAGDGNGAQEAMRRHLLNIIQRINRNSDDEVVKESLFEN